MNFTAWKYSRLIALILIINHPLLAEEDKTVIFKNDAKYSGTDDTYVKKGSSFSGGMSNFGACETMLINENRLSMVDPSARAYLQNEMIKFLFEGGSKRPEEYTPPAE